MRQRKSGGFTAGLWILCIICTVFTGICFDNAQADSCLAYLNTADTAFASGVSGSACGETGVFPAFRGGERGIPAGQAYISEISVQGGYAYIPRKTVRRTATRSLSGGVFFLLSGGIILSALCPGQTAFFSDGLCEVISNTVILRYIHGQDGEKA